VGVTFRVMKKSLLVAAVACALSLIVAATASAADTVYWGNYKAGSIAHADLTGAGGGAFDTSGAAVEFPEGMTIDSATGRLYWEESAGPNEGIYSAKLDGTGAERISAPGAPIDNPRGLAIDPVTRTIYWANSAEEDPAHAYSIAWAKLDGSAAGTLDTAGAELEEPDQIALDPAAGRIFWGNFKGEEKISYANLDGTGGGGNLETATVTTPGPAVALAVDPGADRLYWMHEPGLVPPILSYVDLATGGGGDVPIGTVAGETVWGMAIDPAGGKAYWANYETKASEPAIHVAALGSGTAGMIETGLAPVETAQDPIVQLAPSGVTPPQISGGHQTGSTLSCTQGTWAADEAGSYVYRAPDAYSYAWTLNGAPVTGATSERLIATTAGSYACRVTASDQAGSATQTSGSVQVSAPPATVVPPATRAVLKLTSVKLNRKKGTATLGVNVSGAGRLVLTGRGIAKVDRVVKRSGTVRLLVRPTAAKLKALRVNGRLKVTLKVRFLPATGPAPPTRTKSILLRRTARHR
jgi:hypothetical protein